MFLTQRMVTVKSHSKSGAITSAKNPPAKTVTTKGVMLSAVSDILFTVLRNLIMSFRKKWIL